MFYFLIIKNKLISHQTTFLFHIGAVPASIYLLKVNLERLEQGVNMFKVNNKDSRKVSLLLNLNIFSHLVLVCLLLILNM